jgi:HEAT repeat protein
MVSRVKVGGPEEDMERRLGLSPRGRALAVGIVCLGLWAALGGLRSGARPPESAPAALPAKEELRYDGKSFDQWRTRLLTDLKPQKRVEAITALTAFGLNHYGEEATKAILLMLTSYTDDARSITDHYDPVEFAARDACRLMGAAAVPALRDELKGANKNVRKFCCGALECMQKDAAAAVPDLIAAAKDGDAEVRKAAVEALGVIDRKAPGVVAALTRALKDGEDDIRCAALCSLKETGPDAKSAAPSVVQLLGDKQDACRRSALLALREMKATDPALVSALAARLKDEDPSVRFLAIELLMEVGTRDAAPALKDLLDILAPTTTVSRTDGVTVSSSSPISPVDKEQYEKALEKVLKRLPK